MLTPQIIIQAISGCNSDECVPLPVLNPQASNVFVAPIRLHAPRSAYYGTWHQVSVIHESWQIWIADDSVLPQIIIPSKRRYDLCPTMFYTAAHYHGDIRRFENTVNTAIWR